MVKKKIEAYLGYINEKRKVTILFSTHDLAEMERICDRVILIHDGEVLLDGKVGHIGAFSQYVDLSVKLAEGYHGKMAERDGLMVLGRSGDGWKLRIDKSVLSEQEVMAGLIKNMPVESISVEKQGLEEFVYHLLQDKMRGKDENG